MIEVIIKAGISAFLASIGFGILFNIRGKKLILAGLTGAIGGILYKYSLYLGMSELHKRAKISPNIASPKAPRKFATNSLIPRYSEYLYKMPPMAPVTTFIVCALIPLVPGGGMYYTMLEVIQGNVQEALVKGLETLSIAGVLALGILVVSTGTQFYLRTKRAMETYHFDDNFYNL